MAFVNSKTGEPIPYKELLPHQLRQELIQTAEEILTSSDDPKISLAAVELLAKLGGLF